MKDKIKKFSLVVWSSTLVVFVLILIPLISAQNKEPISFYLVNVWLGDIVVGVIAFIVLLLSATNSGDELAYKAKSTKLLNMNKSMSLTKAVFVLIVIFLGLSGSGIAIQNYLGTKQELNKLKTQQAAPTTLNAIDTDTSVKKGSSKVAGATTQRQAPQPSANKIECIGPDGVHFWTTQKECDDFNRAWGKQPDYADNTTVNCNYQHLPSRSLRLDDCKRSGECEVGPGNWVWYANANDCRNSQNSVSGPAPQQQTQSTGNNVYCWNNTYNYGYYTTSGDKCNEDNFSDGTNKLCQDSQKFKLDLCNRQCQREHDENKAACDYAYTGQNYSDKYGECLNGVGGVGELYGVCLDKCNVQFKQDLGQCK